MDSRLWDGVIELLAPDLRCIALDLPFGAHRHAMRRDADLSARGVARLVADALAALQLDDVTLVGNDSGGAIAQVVAAEHPERLARLVLTPCDCFDNFPPKFFSSLVWAAHVPGDWVRAYCADRGVRRDVNKVTRGLDRHVTEQAARSLARFDRPTLLAFAPEDKLFPMEHAWRLAQIMPDARVTAIEDSRTWVMIDQPRRTAELIRAFVGVTGAHHQEARATGSQSAG